MDLPYLYRAHVEQLSREVAAALQTAYPKWKEWSPAEFAEFIRQDNARWGRAIKASGLKPN